MSKILLNYKSCFKKYLNFKDQATGQEPMLFILANIIVSVILFGITVLIHHSVLVGVGYNDSMFYDIFGAIFFGLLVLQALYILATIIPSFAVVIRYLRNDISGILYLLVLFPIFSIQIILNFVGLFWY